MKGILKVAVLVALLVMAAQTVSALQVDDNESATLDITIAAQTWVNIDPEALSWTGVNPGDVGGSTEEANNYYAIQIENIGSNNISHVWFNASNPTTRPFATGSPTNYNAGNFVVLSNETGPENYYFINRLEFNESKTLVYLTDPGGTMPPDSSTYYYGRIRNASKEWFWFVQPTGVPSECNGTGVNFWIGGTPHTREATGSVDFSSCGGTLDSPGSGCGTGTLTKDDDANNWAYADISLGGQKYTIAVYRTCEKVMVSHWNKDAPGADETGTNAAYFYEGTLTPGNSVAARIKVFVPYGVAVGSVTQGTINVVVNDA